MRAGNSQRCLTAALRPHMATRLALTRFNGLLLDKGQLVLVEFFPPALTFKLDYKTEQARWSSAAPTQFSPSTIARAQNFYLVVNADFGTSTPFGDGPTAQR